MITGSVYGVVLNDHAERVSLAGAFTQKPYDAPPHSPVVYIKPRTCLSFGGAPVPLPADLSEVEVAATIALLFGAVPGVPVAAALALDVCEPHTSYYRPAVRQRCRDGFLPLAIFAAPCGLEGDIVTLMDGVETHRWSVDRLIRDISTLIGDLGKFMTLADGDVLLIGLPGDAPVARDGQKVLVKHPLLPSLSTRIVRELVA